MKTNYLTADEARGLVAELRAAGRKARAHRAYVGSLTEGFREVWFVNVAGV